MKNINLNNQEEYWEINYANKPKMFGLTPSFAAEEALKVFKKNNISSIIELGAGLGRDPKTNNLFGLVKAGLG